MKRMAHFIVWLILLLVIEQAQSRPQPQCFKMAVAHLKTQYIDLLHQWNLTSKLEPGYTMFVDSDKESLEHKVHVATGKFCTTALLGHSSNPRDWTASKHLLEEVGLLQDVSTADVSTDSGSAFCVQDGRDSPLAFVFPKSVARLLCFYQSVVVKISCPHSNHCYNISLHGELSWTGKKVEKGGRLFRRHAQQEASISLQKSRQHEGKEGKEAGHAWETPFSGVLLGVVGLLVLILALAMCGGRGDTFEPGAAETSKKRSSQSEVAAEAAPERPADTGPAAPGDTGPGVKDVNSNGNPASSNTVAAAMVAVTSDEEDHRDSSEQRSNSSLREVSERGRTLSARSHDPLPEVPTLEPASKEGDGRMEGGADDDDEDDDPYAEVPGDQDRMNESDSDVEEDGRGNRGGAAGIPLETPPKDSYGKVSRHSKPAGEPKKPQQEEEEEGDDSDSYAEVRDVMRRGPPFATQRDRSKTDPANPSSLGNVRDKRSLTESAAHMPLPDIPGGVIPPAIAEENAMYDSIPESQLNKSSPPNPRTSSSEIKRKERLYESVDEMDAEAGDKDLYESVPDTFSKVESPVTPNTFSPSLSPTKLPPTEMPPMPPRSPIPSNKMAEQPQGKKEKEAMKKSLSSAAQSEEKRRFSFFNRKKAGSVSSNLKKGEQPKSPTAVTSTTSPQHKPHPLHNLPIPPPPDVDDEEEDTYDKVTVTPGPGSGDHGDHFQLPQPLPPPPPADDVRSKSMSLPMAFRSGGRPNLPLPKLPEDSGSGTVQHQRLMEGEGVVEYDTLQPTVEPVEDEPNYDTVKADDILLPKAAAAAAPPPPAAQGRSRFDPPYDKVREDVQALRQREMELRDTVVHAESSQSPPDPSGGYSKVRGEAPEGELDGQRPEHDEEGYAVVPEEIKMRKRAFSASQTKRKELSPDSIAAGYHLVGHDESLEQQYDMIRDTRSHSLSVSPKKSPGGASPGEEQYATIDMAAKHDKKRRELDEALRLQEELRGYSEDTRGVSPIPPPLPPALSPDQVEGFEPPPIPAQAHNIQEIAGAGGEGLRVPSDAGDPPYAKVKSKNIDNPYAEVNNSTRPYAEVDILTEPPPKAKSSATPAPTITTTALPSNQDFMGESLGYDVIGTVGVRTRVVVSVGDEEEKPYDTIQDVMASTSDAKSAATPSQIKQDTPKLDTVEESGGNIYNTLLPDGEVHGSTDEEDEEEEVKYEEIDSVPRSMV